MLQKYNASERIKGNDMKKNKMEPDRTLPKNIPLMVRQRAELCPELCAQASKDEKGNFKLGEIVISLLLATVFKTKLLAAIYLSPVLVILNE